MGIKKILLASAALALLASPASARDRSGWYVGGSVGYGMVDDIENPGVTKDFSFDGGYGVLGSIGYAFHKHWRTELELGFRSNGFGSFTQTGLTAVVTTPRPGELNEITAMLNLAYDMPISPNMAISLLGGVGVDRATLDYNAPLGDDRDYVFAYQLGAELNFQTSDHWDWFVGYRYLQADGASFSGAKTGTLVDQELDFTKHLISVGFRYGYTVPTPVVVAPPPPPPPPAIKQFIVFFGFNKYNLTSEAQAVVAEAASAAKSQGAASILVTGHTDTVGGNAYNQKLSEKRAGAVKDELVRLGIGSDKITATGKGETELLVQTGDGVKEPQNRRATIDLK